MKNKTKTGFALSLKNRYTGIPWNKDKKGLQVAWNKGQRKGETRTCPTCNIVFYVAKSRLKKRPAKYCSYKCRKTIPWNKGIPSPRFTGKNNPRWKGGITPINEKIRHSLEYKLWREAVFIRDDYTCQICGIRGVKLNADHIKPFAFFPELRLSIDNGRTLCYNCHRNTSTYGNRVYNYEKK